MQANRNAGGDPPVLTLHQGDAQASFVEHPTETVRKTLLAAAEGETRIPADAFRRFVPKLPVRAPAPIEGNRTAVA